MIDRVNRAALAVIAMLLITAGLVGLLAAGEVLRLAEPSQLYGESVAALSAWPWSPPVAAVGGLLLAVVGLWWAARQLSATAPSSRERRLRLEAATGGSTDLRTSAVGRAVAADLETLDGVASARAALHGERPKAAMLHVSMAVDQRLDPADVPRRAEAAFQRAAGVLGLPDLPVRLHIRPLDQRASSRVV